MKIIWLARLKRNVTFARWFDGCRRFFACAWCGAFGGRRWRRGFGWPSCFLRGYSGCYKIFVYLVKSSQSYLRKTKWWIMCTNISIMILISSFGHKQIFVHLTLYTPNNTLNTYPYGIASHSFVLLFIFRYAHARYRVAASSSTDINCWPKYSEVHSIYQLEMEVTYLRSLFQQSALFLRPYLMRLFLWSLPRKRFQSFQWFPPRQWSKLQQQHHIKSRFAYVKK